MLPRSYDESHALTYHICLNPAFTDICVFFFSLMLRFPKREAPSISFLWGLLLSENCGVTLFPETVHWANKRYLVCFSLRIVYSFIIIVVLMVLLLSPLYSLLNQLLVTAPRVYLCILFSTLSSAIRKP
jgi:hypothetical protein